MAVNETVKRFVIAYSSTSVCHCTETVASPGGAWLACSRNHNNYYINIINRKTENYQISVNVQAPGGRGGVPQSAILGDASVLKRE